jgi:hypothetical protein
MKVGSANVLFNMGGRGRRIFRPNEDLATAVPALLKVAASEQAEPRARIAAARAALAIDKSQARQANEVLSLVSLLIETLETGEFTLRATAAETLGLIGPAAREAVPALETSRKLPGPDVDTKNLVRDYVKQHAEEALKNINAEDE